MGYTLLTSYTYSRWIRQTDFLNAIDTDFDERLDNNDVKNRLVVSGIWELPVRQRPALGELMERGHGSDPGRVAGPGDLPIAGRAAAFVRRQYPLPRRRQ